MPISSSCGMSSFEVDLVSSITPRRESSRAYSPARSRIPQRLFACELGQSINRTYKHVSLLICGQLRDVLVRVAMQSDFVPCVSDLGQLLWERFDAVRRCEERCLGYCQRWLLHRVAGRHVIKHTLMPYLSYSFSSRSMPTVAPKMPRETFVGFCGDPDDVNYHVQEGR